VGAGAPRSSAACDISLAGLSYIGNGGLKIRQADSREPKNFSLIALKNMQNLRICHVPKLLDFGGSAVLGCHRVLKSAES